MSSDVLRQAPALADVRTNQIGRIKTVEKESSSTPLRVVFDASAKNSEFTSLNEILHVGPKLQTDICSILLNFRFGPIALTADIKQMYRNIWVRKQDRKYQKILWRPFPDAPIGIYELNTVTFGLSSSPFQAIRTIKQLSRDECSKYSQSISRILENDVYIDDVVTSIDSLDSAKTICEGLQTVLSSGGFELKKWESNNSNLRKLFSDSDVQNKHFSKSDFQMESSTKVLGLKWDPLSDNFSFEIKLTWRKWTKRQLLSVIARIWDPLGFLTPIVVKIKILLKKIWTLKIDWDEELPSFIITSWLAVYSELEHLNNYQIPRYLETSKQNKCSLFGFADSSEQAYGAVVYIKSLGNPNFLLISKSRVTPIKNQTLARLELCACHLLSKLLNFILTNNQHSIDFDSIYCFSDSMIVLHWLAGPATRWKTFVANRVTKIRDLIPNAQWLHIPSNQNAADCVSRGLRPKEFIQHKNWLFGPDWLNGPISTWPAKTVEPSGDIDQERKANALIVKSVIPPINPLYELTQKFSNWCKLVRIFAYILKFCKIITNRNRLLTSDLKQAEVIIIRLVQEHHFPEEFKLLTNGKSCSKKFCRLNLVLDSNNCLRVKGRLGLTTNNNPLLLPKKDQVVNCLIDYYHINNLHTGSNLVLSLLRQKYWILSARAIIRNRLHKCITCFRQNPKPIFPFMGDLPVPRITASRAFLNVGVDYAGPFNISMSRHRGARTYKAYICLFICLATKAIHLELASDLTSDTFLDCLKRFLARRGPIKCIYSDCGTNFIGAKNTLDSLFLLLNSEEYKKRFNELLVLHDIEWKFNPPFAPHFGGIWEANIKSVKTHLFKVIGLQILSYEEFNTVLNQIEALLNSRPLCWLSNDPSDPQPLTPAHFLMQEPLSDLPVDYENLNLTKRKQLLDHIVASYWKRWNVEYLTELQVRQKWNTVTNPIKKGDLVVVKQENARPLHWGLGRVEEVFPGSDGVVRVALVKTGNTLIKRPVVKLCPLPIQ
ncbi:uncharacterized protein LOC113365338 [Ctenocephalides felis]|uniref:uncharacterized protein LOC113365338 n=1 Tax=Ctenocephalides felis TaxID=7515 RepID=UPI000E6E2F13|nr:uncharacterized protein LOC113365338 [Ctenocephalides felis]